LRVRESSNSHAAASGTGATYERGTLFLPEVISARLRHLTVLLTAADGLDGPTSATFGVGKDSKTLYITNAAFPFFPGPTPRRPSHMRLEIGVTGQPRP
jgi:hypothetical protein